MKTILRITMLFIFGIFASTSFAQEVKVVNLNSKDTTIPIPEIRIRKIDGSKLSAAEQEKINASIVVVEYGKTITMVPAQQAYDATQKRAKGKLVYFGKDVDNKLNGVDFINQESSDDFVALGNEVKNASEIYLLSENEKDAKGLVFSLSRLNDFKDKKIHVVKGGLDAWMKL